MGLQREFIWRMQKERITAKQRFERRLVYKRAEKNTETERGLALRRILFLSFSLRKARLIPVPMFFAAFNLQMRRGLSQDVASDRRSSAEYDCYMSKHRFTQKEREFWRIFALIQ